MNDLIQITTTTGDHQIAHQIATELVDRRLAACVQIAGPITSIYHWRGQIERGEEWLCIAKTTVEHFAAAQALIVELHPYETPEIIATPVVAASDAYSLWLKNALV
jgi:periplasmic divalent cation tolerance protein